MINLYDVMHGLDHYDSSHGNHIVESRVTTGYYPDDTLRIVLDNGSIFIGSFDINYPEVLLFETFANDEDTELKEVLREGDYDFSGENGKPLDNDDDVDYGELYNQILQESGIKEKEPTMINLYNISVNLCNRYSVPNGHIKETEIISDYEPDDTIRIVFDNGFVIRGYFPCGFPDSFAYSCYEDDVYEDADDDCGMAMYDLRDANGNPLEFSEVDWEDFYKNLLALTTIEQ